MREKVELRFATMEYGGQCVTMAGMKWTGCKCCLSATRIWTTRWEENVHKL